MVATLSVHACRVADLRESDDYTWNLASGDELHQHFWESLLPTRHASGLLRPNLTATHDSIPVRPTPRN
jgi:hypothetical protein